MQKGSWDWEADPRLYAFASFQGRILERMGLQPTNTNFQRTEWTKQLRARAQKSIDRRTHLYRERALKRRLLKQRRSGGAAAA